MVRSLTEGVQKCNLWGVFPSCFDEDVEFVCYVTIKDEGFL